jgi:flagellar biosynthesis protein
MFHANAPRLPPTRFQYRKPAIRGNIRPESIRPYGIRPFMKEPSTSVDVTINDDNPADIAAPAKIAPAENAIAIALGYPQSNDGAQTSSNTPPKVLATGRGEFAQIILDIAFKQGVKVREDSDLAEILAAVDLDSDIPVEAFIAVAEILRYVYANTNQSPPQFQDPGVQVSGD